jgi:Trk K+ transport system NAD-binding subunit
LALTVLLGTGTWAFRMYYPEPTGGQLEWLEALYATFTLIFFQPDLVSFVRAPLGLKILFFAIPAIGLAVVADGVLRFGMALFNFRERKEAWLMAVASTYHDHIIVCGLGRIGYRVVKELLDWGEKVVGIESDAESPHLEKVTQMKVPVYLGDARQPEMLKQAGVQRASAIVICTEDDITNMDIALDARELNPGIKVVMRMFDARLAERVRRGFHIHTAFSTSALSAPVFAVAATRAQITHSFYVDEDEEQMVARMIIQPGSALEGCTIAKAEQQLDLSIVLHRREANSVCPPYPDLTLRANDCLVMFASRRTLARLGEMSRQHLLASEGKAPIARRRPLLKRLLSRKKLSNPCKNLNERDAH